MTDATATATEDADPDTAPWLHAAARTADRRSLLEVRDLHSERRYPHWLMR